MENIDLQVGDRVTYKYKGEARARVEIIKNSYSVEEMPWFEKHKNDMEILKIERPKYEVIEEKKELLTQEEKEFLQGILKHYEINPIVFNADNMEFYDKDDYMVVACLDYPSNLTFEGVKKNRRYTLKELGLE